MLAGGLVLGLGAIATLAAWSDEVFADGTFVTGEFELEGASDANGTDFRRWDSSAFGGGDSAPLQFEQSTGPTSLSYDEPVHAPLQVRLSPTTSIAGTYSLESVRMDPGKADSPLRDVLEYVVYSGVAPQSCANGDVSAGTVWFAGSVDDSAPVGPSRHLDESAGTTDHLCLSVTLTANDASVQGVSDSRIEWRFHARQAT